MGDPNFILVRRGMALLVSDDFTDEIREVMLDGRRSIFTRDVNHSNGMVALYVAQIFRRINPIEQDDRLWRIPLSDGRPGGSHQAMPCVPGRPRKPYLAPYMPRRDDDQREDAGVPVMWLGDAKVIGRTMTFIEQNFGPHIEQKQVPGHDRPSSRRR
jgi:hypothetical protein